jgi:DNA-binding IclR family transcriptional regulator
MARRIRLGSLQMQGGLQSPQLMGIMGVMAAFAPSPAGGLARDLALLEHLADAEAAGEGGLGVARLAERTGREPSQVSRALTRLAEAGLVARDGPARAYRLGPGLFGLAARVIDGRLLAAAAEPMRRLSAQLDETIHLCVLRGDDVVTLRTEAPAHRFRAGGWIGVPVPAPCTSAGRALLMDVPDAELLRRFRDHPFAARGPRSRVLDAASLVAVVAEGRTAGFAAVDEEFEAGVAGVSAPIRDARGTIVAAINVSAPTARLCDRLDAAGAAARAAADEASAALGWLGPGAGRPS